LYLPASNFTNTARKTKEHGIVTVFERRSRLKFEREN
jgi:hypothetical protein